MARKTSSLVHVMKYKSNGDPVMYRTTQDEHHLTFTCECGPFSENYLTHVVIGNGTGSTMVSATLNVFIEYDSIESLGAIVLENTSSNTGVDNDLVVKLEKLLKCSIHIVGCSLYQGELLVCHVISEIDGKTNDPKKHKGPIGEQASGIFMHEQPLIQFIPIDLEIELNVNPDIVSDLSTDQCKLYEYCIRIAKGFISIKYANK